MDGHDTLKAARAPGAQVRAWLLDRLRDGDWKTAAVLEAARVEAGIGKRALRTARERLLADGAIEKGRDGFQGAFRYRRAGRAAVAESLAPESEAAAVRAVPEVPEVPERFAATLRLLASAPMAAADGPPYMAVVAALDRLATDCGYTLEYILLHPPAPDSPRSALSGPRAGGPAVWCLPAGAGEPVRGPGRPWALRPARARDPE